MTALGLRFKLRGIKTFITLMKTTVELLSWSEATCMYYIHIYIYTKFVRTMSICFYHFLLCPKVKPIAFFPNQANSNFRVSILL